MANVTFGTGSIGKPTPSGINLWVRVATITIGIFLLWMPSAPSGWFSSATQDGITSLLGLITLMINGLAPLFGIDVPTSGKVPAEEVSAMDNKK